VLICVCTFMYFTLVKVEPGGPEQTAVSAGICSED
jgi:hypothetical protein